MSGYVANIHVPGYLPEGDMPTFETAAEAWRYLADEMERGELSHAPDDWSDLEGPQSCTSTYLEVQRMEREDRVGAVHGPSYLAPPDEDTSTDLGLVYEVQWSDEDDPNDL
jgi:hypothetical protein